jgi:hypothetical protein
MSCVHFNTPNQRQQFAQSAGDREPIAQWLGPQLTQSKIDRVTLMSTSGDVKIREAAATSAHATEAVYWALAADKQATVRQWLARNEKLPQPILVALSDDSDELVRCYVVLNYSVDADIIEKLAQDPSEKVRALVHWKREQAA